MASGSRNPTIQELIESHHALLYRYAYRLCGSAVDADDLTQQTYLIAHEKIRQLRDPQSAKSWLCTILRHAYLRIVRHQTVLQPLDYAKDYPQPVSHDSFDEEALQLALSKLPEEYRSAVILYYFQELSYQEIAEVLEIPLGTVMSRLSRGKSQLKVLLELRGSRLPVPQSPGSSRPAKEILKPRLVSIFPN